VLVLQIRISVILQDLSLCILLLVAVIMGVLKLIELNYRAFSTQFKVAMFQT
jgi:hypothetical protein